MRQIKLIQHFLPQGQTSHRLHMLPQGLSFSKIKYAEIKAQSPLSVENILMLKPLVHTIVCAAEMPYFTPEKNLIPVLAGQVSGIRLMFRA